MWDAHIAIHYIGKKSICPSLPIAILNLANTVSVVKFGYLNQPPLELHNLLTSQDQRAKGFHTNIRKYNNAPTMTSLLSAPNQPPVYAQLYIYNSDNALTYCIDNLHNVSLNRTIMSNLQDMLHHYHHGVALYKSAMEITKDMPSELQCKIGLCYNPGTNCHCYNLPTMSGEVAVVIPEMSEEMSNSQDIILYCRQREYHQCI